MEKNFIRAAASSRFHPSPAPVQQSGKQPLVAAPLPFVRLPDSRLPITRPMPLPEMLMSETNVAAACFYLINKKGVKKKEMEDRK
jgi:hypothetical protein